MKRVAVLSLTALIMIGCTSRDCEPKVEYIKQKFPRLETVEVNTSVVIPSYRIERDKIKIDENNVIMSVDTFREIKSGDAKKVEYLKRHLKLFIYVYEMLNGQIEKYNKEFVYEQR